MNVSTRYLASDRSYSRKQFFSICALLLCRRVCFDRYEKKDYSAGIALDGLYTYKELSAILTAENEENVA